MTCCLVSCLVFVSHKQKCNRFFIEQKAGFSVLCGSELHHTYSTKCLFDRKVACTPDLSLCVFDRQCSVVQSSNTFWLMSMKGDSKATPASNFIHASIFPTQCSILKSKPETRLQRGCDKATEVGALGPHIPYKSDHNHVKRQKACVGNIWRCHGPGYMYICIGAWTVSSTPFSQDRSTVIEFKYITSKCLVQFLYMCMGCFFLWGCFVL